MTAEINNDWWPERQPEESNEDFYNRIVKEFEKAKKLDKVVDKNAGSLDEGP